MRLVLAAFFSLLALPAAAQTIRQEIYEGTIGKSPIVLEILTYKDGRTTLRSGEYFYTKYRSAIPLKAGKAPLTFTETDPSCFDTECQDSATLALKGPGETLAGTWQASGKPARVAVALKRVSARDYTTSLAVKEPSVLPSVLTTEEVLAVSGGNPFQQKLYDFDLTNGAETHSGSVGYRTVTHKGTGVSYIRLTQLPDAAVLKLTNVHLDQRRYDNQMGALDCAAMRAENDQIEGFGGYEDIEVKVAYVTPQILFIEESGSTYCGGAHPNNYWTRMGYDLKTGGALDMNRLLKLYTKPAGWQEGDELPDTAEFKALQAKLKPKSPWFVGGADIPECLAEDLGYGYSLSFNAKGLVFSLTDLPHVMGACMGEYYVVPYKDLKSLWRPEAKAYFPGIA